MSIVSGMRPTGKLHLGHYFGVLKNWLTFQEERESFFLVADWHALTTQYQHTESIQSDTLQMTLDWLACGIDPEKSTLFIQSQVKEHAELFLLLSMFTPMGWLLRNPTFKEQINEIKDKDINHLGFFSYPVLQATDVLLYKGEQVPVGKDQVPHVEIMREIARRFNFITKTSVFPEPQEVLTPTSKLMGLDGRKMSKSYGNAILLSDTKETVEKKIRTMVTDPQRIKRLDPGDPEKCNLFPLHQTFSQPATIQEVTAGCTSASIGCVDCKKMLIPNINAFLEPILEKRHNLEKQPDLLQDILSHGQRRAAAQAGATLNEVRQTLKLPTHDC